jgi:hypothetical protein
VFDKPLLSDRPGSVCNKHAKDELKRGKAYRLGKGETPTLKTNPDLDESSSKPLKFRGIT